MKQKLLWLFVIGFIVGAKAQVPADSLNINPNPFVKRTSVYFSFSYQDTVTIKVYNTIGQIVTNIINLYSDSVMQAGIYNDSLKMDAYPDGIYFVMLKLGHRKTITKKVVKSITAGIKEDPNNISDIQIYPNPTTGKFYLDSEKADKLILTDQLGRMIFVIKNPKPKQEIDISYLSNAVYYLRVEGQGIIKVLKLLKT